jgi:hypothetical protein
MDKYGGEDSFLGISKKDMNLTYWDYEEITGLFLMIEIR